MGNFMSPQMGSAPQGAKQRYNLGQLSDYSRMNKFQNSIGNQNPLGNQNYEGGLPKQNYGSNRFKYSGLTSTGGYPGAGGLTGPSIGEGNPLGTEMGNQAATNIGIQGLQGVLSGIPGAMVANQAYGLSLSQSLGLLAESGMMSALGPVGLANVLGGVALSGHQGSNVALSQGQNAKGLGAAAATASLSSPMGIIGMLMGQGGHALGTALGFDMGIAPTNAAGELAFGAEPGSQGPLGIDSPAQGFGNPGPSSSGIGMMGTEADISSGFDAAGFGDVDGGNAGGQGGIYGGGGW